MADLLSVAVWLRDYPAPAWERDRLRAFAKALDCSLPHEGGAHAEAASLKGETDHRKRAEVYRTKAGELRRLSDRPLVLDVADGLVDLAWRVKVDRIDELVRRFR